MDPEQDLTMDAAINSSFESGKYIHLARIEDLSSNYPNLSNMLSMNRSFLYAHGKKFLLRDFCFLKFLSLWNSRFV